MRSDDTLDSNLREARAWQGNTDRMDLTGLKQRIPHSFSGHERDRLFVSDGARQFMDLSGLSGLDSPADGRAFVIWDFDRDGWIDFATVNANRPTLNIFHNELAGQPEADTQGRVVAVRFAGGNHTDRPSPTYAPRDGYGATVRVAAGDLRLLREHRCGEGMSAQNSPTMLIGIGPHQRAQTVEVQWPSGSKQAATDVPAGTLLTFYEDPAHSPDKSHVTRAPYARRARLPSAKPPVREQLHLAGEVPRDPAGADGRGIVLHTTMATWCAACKRHLPQLRHLRETFPSGTLSICAVPIDPRDTSEKLAVYARQHEPPYHLLSGLSAKQRTRVQELVARSLGHGALPASVITNQRGDVLSVQPGIPSVSSLRELVVTDPAETP